jgi:hypothetical protein
VSAFAVVVVLRFARASLLGAVIAAKALARADSADAIGMRTLRHYHDIACRFGL